MGSEHESRMREAKAGAEVSKALLDAYAALAEKDAEIARLTKRVSELEEACYAALHRKLPFGKGEAAPCGCMNNQDPDWHSNECPVPKLRAALAHPAPGGAREE